MDQLASRVGGSGCMQKENAARLREEGGDDRRSGCLCSQSSKFLQAGDGRFNAAALRQK